MSVYDGYELPESTGLYLKFEDGKEVRLRILSPEPVVFESVFTRGEEETISTKYGFVIINRAIESAQVMQIPVTAFRQILAYAKDADYGDPTQYDLKITRTGTGKDTEYRVIPGPNKSEPTDGEKEAAAQINLKEVTKKGKGVQHVFYLSETQPKEKDGPLSKNSVTMGKDVDEISVEDIQDRPIDMSEIPF